MISTALGEPTKHVLVSMLAKPVPSSIISYLMPGREYIFLERSTLDHHAGIVDDLSDVTKLCLMKHQEHTYVFLLFAYMRRIQLEPPAISKLPRPTQHYIITHAMLQQSSVRGRTAVRVQKMGQAFHQNYV